MSHLQKRSFIAVAIAASVASTLFGCGRAISESAGSTKYVFNNQTSRTVELHFTAAPGSPVGDGAVACQAGAECLIAEDSIIGVNPSPTDSFASIAGIADERAMRVRVFLQEPPVDARWTVGGQALTFTPCCSARDVTLTLTDADLTVP